MKSKAEIYASTVPSDMSFSHHCNMMRKARLAMDTLERLKKS